MYFGRPVVFACRGAVGQICAGDVMRMFGLARIMCCVATAALLCTAAPRSHHPPPSFHKQHFIHADDMFDQPLKVLFIFRNVPEWATVAVEMRPCVLDIAPDVSYGLNFTLGSFTRRCYL